MSGKIIGVTVGTPTSARKIENDLKPVKSINGKVPDAKGNVDIENALGYTPADAEKLADQVGALSNEIGAYSTITLGIHTDGLVYIFKDGKPIGSGIKLPEGGGLPGYVDSAGNIVLEGEYPDGTRVKYVLKDGSLADIGEIELVEEPLVYTNLVPQAKDINGTVIGYVRDSYYSVSSGSNIIGTAAGYTLIGIMPIASGMTHEVYVYGIDFTGDSKHRVAAHKPKGTGYDISGGASINNVKVGEVASSSVMTNVTKLGDHYYKISTKAWGASTGITMSGSTVEGIEPIVAIDEPIFRVD